jgi:hypothetical protein
MRRLENDSMRNDLAALGLSIGAQARLAEEMTIEEVGPIPAGRNRSPSKSSIKNLASV